MKHSKLLCLSLATLLLSSCIGPNKNTTTTSTEPPAPDYSEDLSKAFDQVFQDDKLITYTSSYYEDNGLKATRIAFGEGFYGLFHDTSVEGYVKVEGDNDSYHSFTSYDFTNQNATSTIINIGKRVDYTDDIVDQLRWAPNYFDFSKFDTKSSVEGDRYSVLYSSTNKSNISDYLEILNTEHEQVGFIDNLTEVELLVTSNSLSKIYYYTTSTEGERVKYATVSFSTRYAGGYEIKEYAEDPNNIQKPAIFDLTKISKYTGKALYEGYRYKFEEMLVTPKSLFRSAINKDQPYYGFVFEKDSEAENYENALCDFTATIGTGDGYVTLKDLVYTYANTEYIKKGGYYPSCEFNNGTRFKELLIDDYYAYEFNGTLVACNNLTYYSHAISDEKAEIKFTYLVDDTIIFLNYVYYSYDPDFDIIKEMLPMYLESVNAQMGVTRFDVSEAHFVYNNGEFFLGARSSMTYLSFVED